MALMDNPLSLDMMTGGQMNGLSRNLMQMRAMRYMHEPYVRPGRMPSQGRPNPLITSVDNSPDYSQFTYNPDARAAAEQALSPYGLHPLEASQVNPNAILPNSGFFGAHPNLSRMIEGGIFGAANTQGSDTIGEGISNVARSLISGPQMRNQMLERQFQAPFQQAQMLEQMRGERQKYDLNDSEIKYRQAQMDRWADTSADKAQQEATKIQLGYDKLNATAPRPVEGGAWVYGGTDKGWQFEAGPGGKSVRQGGGGVLGEMIRGQLGTPPPDGTKQAQAYWQKANSIVSRYQGGQAYARGVGSAKAGLDTDTKETVTAKNARVADAKGDAWIAKQKPSFWLRNGIKPSDPNFGQKAKAFYNNLVGGQDQAAPQAAPAGVPQSSAAPASTGSKFAQAFLDYKKSSALKQAAPSNFLSPMGDNMNWLPQPISPIPPVGQIQSPFPR